MKRGIRRDLIFVAALLAVFVGGFGTALAYAFVAWGPWPADPYPRELYAAAVKSLAKWLITIGATVVSYVYLWRLGVFAFVFSPMHRISHTAAATPIPDSKSSDDDASLPGWLGWGFLLTFVSLMAIILAVAATRPG